MWRGILLSFYCVFASERPLMIEQWIDYNGSIIVLWQIMEANIYISWLVTLHWVKKNRLICRFCTRGNSIKFCSRECATSGPFPHVKHLGNVMVVSMCYDGNRWIAGGWPIQTIKGGGKMGTSCCPLTPFTKCRKQIGNLWTSSSLCNDSVLYSQFKQHHEKC